MRINSDRDERIIGELARHAGNDFDIVREALNEVNALAAEEHRKVSVEEAVDVVKRLRAERHEPADVF